VFELVWRRRRRRKRRKLKVTYLDRLLFVPGNNLNFTSWLPHASNQLALISNPNHKLSSTK
jgi:hypothetical protein